MNTEPITHLVNSAIECLLIAAFIGGVITFMGIRDDQAQAYNTQIELQESINRQLEFDEYKTGESITGNHVIETIRKYRDGKIRVYVDKTSVEGVSVDMTAASYEENPYLFSVAYLSEIINPSDYYDSYLVYDSDPMTEIDSFGDEITGIAFIKR